MAKKIALLGSTGSIGTQALEVIMAQGYEVVALTANTSVDEIEKQILKFKPALVGMANEDAAEILRIRMAGFSKKPLILAGKKAAQSVVLSCDADIVLNAIVGIAGLSATLAALSGGINVALANKESLVAGGKLVMKTAKQQGALLLPVDSEHSAIFQCLQDYNSAPALRKILLTASGGPFYGKTREELKNITKNEALKHPNWSMGAKITIDSATLMNKGLELIEAQYLFALAPKDIEIVVQKESIIHSMVEFVDHSILAQLGVPDMRIPIQYALTWPKRVKGCTPALDFNVLTGLSFGKPDEDTFRCLAACRKAAEKGGLAPCAANGAGEAAVNMFLREEISFLEIGRLVEGCVDADAYAGDYDIEDVYACDEKARSYVKENAKRLY